MQSVHLCMYALVIVIIIVHWTCQCFLPPGNQSKFYKFAWTMYIHIVIAIVTHVTYLRSWFPPKSWSQSHWQGRCQELCWCLPPKIASSPLYPWQKDENGDIETSKKSWARCLRPPSIMECIEAFCSRIFFGKLLILSFYLIMANTCWCFSVQ